MKYKMKSWIMGVFLLFIIMAEVVPALREHRSVGSVVSVLILVAVFGGVFVFVFKNASSKYSRIVKEGECFSGTCFQLRSPDFRGKVYDITLVTDGGEVFYVTQGPAADPGSFDTFSEVGEGSAEYVYEYSGVVAVLDGECALVDYDASFVKVHCFAGKRDLAFQDFIDEHDIRYARKVSY